jgi:hypothetical protein
MLLASDANARCRQRTGEEGHGEHNNGRAGRAVNHVRIRTLL